MHVNPALKHAIRSPRPSLTMHIIPRRKLPQCLGTRRCVYFGNPLRLAAPIKSSPMMHRSLVMPISTPCVVDRSNPARGNATLHDSFSGGWCASKATVSGYLQKVRHTLSEPRPLESSSLFGSPRPGSEHQGSPPSLPSSLSIGAGRMPPDRYSSAIPYRNCVRPPRRDAAAPRSQSSRPLLLQGLPRLGNPAKTLIEHVCVG